MKNQIPQFLKDNLTNKNARPKFFPQDLKQFILDYGKFYEYPNTKNLEDNHLISLWFRYMKSNITDIGFCEYNGCNNKKRIVNKSDSNRLYVSRGCCTQHSLRTVMLETYGVENPMHLQSSKDKIKETNLERFGVEHPMELESIRNKIAETMLARYGYDNNFKNNEFMQNAFKEKYGVTNPSMVAEFQEKKKVTCLKNFGVENPNHSSVVRDKINKTNLKKFGTEFPIMLSNGFGHKEYKWKTGEISIVQGYEPIVLKELEDSGYTYEMVITGTSRIPTIPYEFENKKHKYYPDIFIPSENLIIEVKSEYTLNKEFDRNQAKFQAVKELGFNFKLEVR